MTRGVIYINSAHEDLKYVREAVRSAESLRKLMPDLSITLHTDAVGFTHPVFNRVVESHFEAPKQLENRVHMRGQLLAKIKAMLEFEYDYTLYLGSDTLAVRSEFESVFRLLERFDFAAAHAPLRINTQGGNSSIPELPPCYPEFNGDVLLYKKTPEVEKVLNDWRDLYVSDRFSHPHDQGTLRYVLYHSPLRIATLPPEYNSRGSIVAPDTVLIHNRYTIARHLGEDGFARSVLSSIRRLGSRAAATATR